MNRTAKRAVKSRIKAWDFSIEKRYMVEKNIYSAEEIDLVERDFKRWLMINVCNPDRNSPINESLDNFWHSIILFTQNYENFCDATVGYFIHHRPGILDDQAVLEQQYRDNTLPLYRKEHGVELLDKRVVCSWDPPRDLQAKVVCSWDPPRVVCSWDPPRRIPPLDSFLAA